MNIDKGHIKQFEHVFILLLLPFFILYIQEYNQVISSQNSRFIGMVIFSLSLLEIFVMKLDRFDQRLFIVCFVISISFRLQLRDFFDPTIFSSDGTLIFYCFTRVLKQVVLCFYHFIIEQKWMQCMGALLLLTTLYAVFSPQTYRIGATKSKAKKCYSQRKTIKGVLEMYELDHDNRMPNLNFPQIKLLIQESYLSSPLYCPSDRKKYTTYYLEENTDLICCFIHGCKYDPNITY